MDDAVGDLQNAEEHQNAGNQHWAPFVRKADDENLASNVVWVVVAMVAVGADVECLLSVMVVAFDQRQWEFEVEQVRMSVKPNEWEVEVH